MLLLALYPPTSPRCSPPFIMTVLVVVVAQPPRGHAGCVSLNTSLFMWVFSSLCVCLCVCIAYALLNLLQFVFQFFKWPGFWAFGISVCLELGLSYSVAGQHQSSPNNCATIDTIAQMCTIVRLVSALVLSNSLILIPFLMQFTLKSRRLHLITPYMYMFLYLAAYCRR